MATNKNRINAYVGDTEYSSFTAFCEQWQCSQSKGVELMIRHFLMGESNVNGSVNGNVTDVSTDELSELKERLGKLESNVISNVNGVTEDWVKQAIADSIIPIADKLTTLSIRLKNIESEIGGKYHIPVDVKSTPVEDADPPSELTAIPVTEPLAEKQPLNELTPQNEDSPIEDKIDGLLSEIEGQSEKVTDENTERGLLGKELALKIGLLRKNGQPSDDTLSKWAKKREQGLEISVSPKNKPAYAEFLKWEKKGDRWFRQEN